jgi:BirA family transcriptional regulator, biotin operon repressor / biotin---[acetyl-CoA-carboxylase] ligase
MGSAPLSPLGSRAPFGGRRFPFLANVLTFETLPSTNDLGKMLAERMLGDGTELRPTAIVARRQTAGRGRSGRTWTDLGDSGLSLSLLLPWPEGPERVRLPIALGVLLAAGLSKEYGLDVRLKWPNDLLVGGKKLGGLLVEARAGDDGEGYAVAGLGLNVRATRPDLEAAGLPRATSLAAEGVAAERCAPDAVLESILSILDAGLAAPWPELPAAFETFSALRPGERLSVKDGGRETSGVYLGVTADGFLRLGTEGGEETVLSGDVASF